MTLSPEQMDRLMQLLGLTRDVELNCNECLEQVSEYADCELRGKSIPEALRAVEEHLRICGECREEYEALRQALDELGEEA